MVAVADKGYLEAKLRDARNAERRTKQQLTKAFGSKRAKEIFTRASRVAHVRICEDNPALYR